MTPYYLEDSVVVLGVLMVCVLVWTMVKVYHYCNTVVREESGKKTTIVESYHL
jgi:hypothetical protein